MITDYHASYYAHELSRVGGTGVDRLGRALFDACVDLNPHQIEAALFALRSPLSKGVLLADEVGLGKTIAAEAQWFANESESEELKAAFQKAGSEALEQVASNKNASRYANDIAIVTGVSPNSIAAQVVEGLLAGGATVVATSHSFKPSATLFWPRLRHA